MDWWAFSSFKESDSWFRTFKTRLRTTCFHPLLFVFPHAERSPGNDWCADDGLHGGDGERGEGDDLHPSVFMWEHGRRNPVWHRRRGYHLDQQGVRLCFLLVELTVLLNITYSNDIKCLNLSPWYRISLNTMEIQGNMLQGSFSHTLEHFNWNFDDCCCSLFNPFCPLNCRWMSTWKKSWLRSKRERHRAPSLLGVLGCVAFFSFLVNCPQTVCTICA